MSDTRPRRTRTAQKSTLARHGRLPKTHATATIFTLVGMIFAVLLASSASVGIISVSQLKSQIKTVVLPGEKPNAPAPDLGSYAGGFNFLLVGSDTRTGQGAYAGKDQGVLNDVTMILHVSEDQTNAVAVSIPRDMVVPIPACPRIDGKGKYSAMSGLPINNTLAYGGLPCTVLTVEALTGLSIPFAGLITFQGVIEMTTAIGGVPVCINGPMIDKYSAINLPRAGTYNLSGFPALAFLRSRHGVGDGSDLGRISSQQVFLSSLVRTIKSNDTLTNIPKLFGIAGAATRNMTLSSGLSNLNTMVAMALVLKNIPLNRITFVQYPSTTGVGGIYAGKVAPIVPDAKALFAKIKADEAFILDSGTGRGSVKDPTAPGASAAPVVSATPVAPGAKPTATAGATATAAPTGSSTAAPSPSGTSTALAVLPGVLGQTAADYTCSKVNN